MVDGMDGCPYCGKLVEYSCTRCPRCGENPKEEDTVMSIEDGHHDSDSTMEEQSHEIDNG